MTLCTTDNLNASPGHLQLTVDLSTGRTPGPFPHTSPARHLDDVWGSDMTNGHLFIKCFTNKVVRAA